MGAWTSTARWLATASTTRTGASARSANRSTSTDHGVEPPGDRPTSAWPARATYTRGAAGSTWSCTGCQAGSGRGVLQVPAQHGRPALPLLQGGLLQEQGPGDDPQEGLPRVQLPPGGRERKDLQPDERAVPLQGRGHRARVQPVRKGLPAVRFPDRPVHQGAAKQLLPTEGSFCLQLSVGLLKALLVRILAL